MEAFIALVCPLFPEIARRAYVRNENDTITCKINTMDIFEQVAEMKWREARQEGLEEALEKSVRVLELLASTENSVEKIASLVGVPVTFVMKLAKEVRTK